MSSSWSSHTVSSHTDFHHVSGTHQTSFDLKVSDLLFHRLGMFSPWSLYSWRPLIMYQIQGRQPSHAKCTFSRMSYREVLKALGSANTSWTHIFIIDLCKGTEKLKIRGLIIFVEYKGGDFSLFLEHLL